MTIEIPCVAYKTVTHQELLDALSEKTSPKYQLNQVLFFRNPVTGQWFPCVPVGVSCNVSGWSYEVRVPVASGYTTAKKQETELFLEPSR